MIILHSLSTGPWNINCYNLDLQKRAEGTMWYYATSVAFVKKLRPDISFNLHTDNFGKELLSFIPYDFIFDDVEKLNKLSEPYKIHPRFWAAAKFVGMCSEPLNSVHIDGDVFLKSKNLIEELEDSKEDVVVQNFEEGQFYSREYPLFRLDSSELEKEGFDLNRFGAYNTGTLKFNSQELKTKFIDGYFNCCRFYTQVGKEYLDTSTNATPDLVVEQQRLYQLCDNYSVRKLLPHNTQVDAINKGYQHVISYGKFACISKVKEMLKQLDPELYAATEKAVQNLKLS